MRSLLLKDKGKGSSSARPCLAPLKRGGGGSQLGIVMMVMELVVGQKLRGNSLTCEPQSEQRHAERHNRIPLADKDAPKQLVSAIALLAALITMKHDNSNSTLSHGGLQCAGMVNSARPAGSGYTYGAVHSPF